MRKFTFVLKAISATLVCALIFVSNTANSQCLSGTIEGNVYVDGNFDGIYDVAETGKAGVFVRIYNSQGNLVNQTITEGDGSYSIQGLEDGNEYRLQYQVPNGSYVSAVGPDNHSDVQFVTVPYCDAALGIIEETSNCTPNTEIYLTCFVNGLGLNSPTQETVIGLTHNFDASSTVKAYANQTETGAVWGIAYKNTTSEIFTSAYVKQHASLTTGGHDAIYVTKVSDTPSTSLFTKLSQLGQSVGTLGVTDSKNCAYGEQVGNIGLGALEIDDTEEHLYVTNLYNNTVVKIKTSSPTTANTETFAVPNPGCSFNDFKVFALKYYQGDLYVGVTCTGETSKDTKDLSFHVYKMNTATGTFNLIFSANEGENVWDPTQLNTTNTLWLKDIEFTDAETMILGIADKVGDTFCNGSSSRVDDQYGDILMVYWDNNQWNLENNGTAGTRVGTGVNNGEGPGGGEFFGDDFFPKDPSDHSEIGLGSLFALPNTNEVITAVYDPLFNTYSGGLHRYSAVNGQRVGGKELYNHNIDEYFGKATGFGDITASCGILPVEIGNYVWIDEDNNGIQDAGEKALSGYTIVICDDTCTPIGTTTTDANGNYSFNSTNVDVDGDGNMDGLIPGKKYYVSLDPNLYNDGALSFVIDGNYYFPTVTNGDAVINSDLVSDLDVCDSGDSKNLPMVEVTAVAGNNTTFDLGLHASNEFDLALRKTLTTPGSIKIGESVEFAIQVYNQGGLVASQFEIVDYLSDAYSFKAEDNAGWTLDGNKARKTVNMQLAPGQSHTEYITLDVTASNNIADYTNVAEITSARNHEGVVTQDTDSTADDIADNDTGGTLGTNTDDQIDDDGTVDEDDHDPANIKIMDLALLNIIKDDRNYDLGELVTFEMTVYNQGNIAATEIEVTNQFEEYLQFNSVNNPGWTQTTGSTVSTTITETLDPGASTTVEVTFVLQDVNDYQDIINYAEITSFTAEDPNVLVDFDSTPDLLFNNDIGGDPYGVTDNMIDDHGTLDEDDHDPAFLRVRKIDLALIKTTLTKVQHAGGTADFEIMVVNQGDITVKSLTVVDYMPDFTTLVDDSWTVDSNDPTNRTVYKKINFTDGLLPGATHTETIQIKLDEQITPGVLINEAEIAEVIDMNGMDISDLDVDSKADMDKDNDAGGQIETDKDDKLDGNGIDDEDDHDPAALYVATIAIDGLCDCLENATTPFDGQFLERIVVTAPSGQTWNVDYAVGIFDPTSPAPPALPTPFTTGDAGYLLTEYAQGDGTSEYVLEGIIEDNETYSIRVYNEDAAFLQVSGGGASCSYDDVVIVSSTDGLSAVCANSTHTYEIQNTFGCNDFTWSVNGGGAIMGPNDENTVTVNWLNSGGPYTLSLTPNCSGLCIAPISTDINVGLGDGAMACRHDINVSLGLDCTTEVVADMILTNPAGGDVVYQVMLKDEHGDFIPNNLLSEIHLWTEIEAKVIDPCNGNSCWANITVEDKMPPVIQCGDIEMPCWQMDSYEPIVYDNCTNATWTLLSETITPIICDDDYIKEVNRVYIAEDEYGNQSQPCNQTITLERIDLGGIVWPEDFLLLDNTNLSCMDSLYDETGFPRIEITGVPTLEGGDLYPVPDVYCNLGVKYDDFLVSEFGCVKKIMRTWTVYESWCTVGQVDSWTQTIEIVDTNDPVVECPEDMEISSSGGTSCTATVTLPLPVVTDDCSTEFEIDIAYPGGFLDNVDAPQVVTLDAGVNEITYTVYDGCENSTSCTMYITVIDEAPPTAVCDQNTIVSLRSDGTAKAFAHTFDDGSFDDCSLFKMLVRRMGTNCDCHTPVYDNMRYLGERSGRYYYLSNFKTHGFKAFAYAEAFGGFLTTLESYDEHEWVYNQVSQEISGNYYIGMSDEGHEGEFKWSTHAPPTYNNWEGGAPINIGDNVVTNANGKWEVVNGGSTEAYFVMEVSDSCTFSNEVHFCCADVADEQMVIFRAIDYFGQYNDCMVNVEVQDKVAPEITCPDDTRIDCLVEYDLNDLSEYGEAVATDVCGVTLTEEVMDSVNICREGYIKRVFTAFDNNGSSSCEQTISIVNMHPFNPATIIWPQDFDSDQGCNSGDLHPDNLPFINAYPQIVTDACDQVAPSFSDQTFSFAGTGSDACLKILRTWTVIDWCEMDKNPNYQPEVYEQTIKITNTDGPTIISGCDTLVVNTLDCDFGEVMFTVEADDDCTPLNMLDATLEIDEDSDGDFEYTEDIFGNILSFSGNLNVGEHVAFASFEDMCGNKTTCAKIIQVNNVTPPTAACIEGLAVALVPMDLDDDGTPDNEMTCVFPDMIDASSTHICDFEINLSFSADTTDDKIIFDCMDIGIQTVALWVTDEFGNTASCETTVEVQDNNDVDFCPRFDLALIKTIDTIATPGPYMKGDDITYEIEVINQGNIFAYRIEVVDYVPDGLTLNDPNWTYDMGTGVASYDIEIPELEDSTSTKISITFTIDDDYDQPTITNFAEISFADNDTDPNNEVMEEADSDPDDMNDDTVGGDDVTDNTNGDEDDHDPEVIEVHNFDLALTKVLDTNNSPMEINPGDDVTFTITVYNQGTLEATDILVEDYVPNDMEFIGGNNTDFSESGGDVTATIASLAPGASVDLSIELRVDADFPGMSIVNNAEIKSADNSLGFIDEDSPLSMMNDGSSNELATDNDIDDEFQGTPGTADNPNDEDDYDPAEIMVVCDLPPLCSPMNTTVSLDDMGDASITVNDIDDGSAAVCDGSSITLALDETDFDCTDIGFNTVTLTVSDSNGTSSSCTATVTVEDNENPTVSCADVTIDYTNGDPLEVLLDINTVIVSQSDNCNIVSEEFDLTAVDSTDLECTPMTGMVVVTDQSDNTGTCEFLIVVTNDAPEASCVAGFVAQLDGNGEVTILPSMVEDGNSSDDCTDYGDLTFEIDINMLDCDNLVAATIITLTVTDESGLTDTCTSSVTVEDNVPPMAICEDRTLFLNANGVRNINPGIINDGSNDNCTRMMDLIVELDQSQFTCDDIGVNTVTLTVTDEQGNSSTCSAQVTIMDTLSPTVTCQPDFTISLDDMGNASIVLGDIIASSDDNCEVASEVISDDTFDCTDAGTTIVVVATVTDGEGNTATCDTEVTVEDDSAPECTLLQDVTFNVDELVDIGDILDTYTDNCNSASASFVIDPIAFPCDSLGMATITVTVSDDSGNTATCSETVTVEDIVDPICEAMDITVNLEANGQVNIDGTDVDNGSTAGCVGIDTLVVVPDFFACNDVGPNVVTLTVTSNNGNTADCTATVTVQDTIPPVIQCVVADTFDLNDNGEYVVQLDDIIISSTDECGIMSEEINVDTLTCADKDMIITVTATATDMNGNTATCTSEIVVEDNTNPECTLLPDLQFVPDVTITVADVLDTFTDNCATGSAAITTDSTFTCDDVGLQLIEVMVTDTCGNSNTCATMIEIIDDSAPTCVTQDITVSLDQNGMYDLDASEVDNGSAAVCGGSVTLEVNPNMFFCPQIGMNTVTLTVTSSGGVSSECTATVTVVDDLPPVIVCPSDMFLACNTDLSDLDVFGTATADDNCDNFPTITEIDSFDVNTCNVGEVIRTFTATDAQGNTSSCQQELIIFGPNNPITEADITWPDTPFDAGDCIADPNNIDSGMPIVDTSNSDCFNISISFTDFDPTPMTDGCNDTYERTWTVVDSCQLDGMGGGIFTFLQIINLNDTVGPTITGPMDTIIILDPMSTTCDTFINLPGMVTDCIGGFSSTNDSPFADNNMGPDASGTYPAGETVVTISAVDTCGNISTYEYSVNVVDTTATIESCVKFNVTIQMNMTAIATTDEADVVIDSDLNCPDSLYTLSWSNMTPNQDTIIYDCDDVGEPIPYVIYLWSGGVLIDSCENLVLVMDGGGFCPPTSAGIVEGSVYTEDDKMVDNVAVALVGSPFEPDVTDEEGKYAFPEMPFGGSYEVVPIKDIDPLNGVSTLDLIYIQRHILGIERLDSPYKLIAADVDNSGSVTTTDLLELRKLIIGHYTDFPDNTSWRMVDADYNFVDPYNPFINDIKEDYEITTFDNSMEINFIGVKIGDVNNSVVANARDNEIEGRSADRFEFVLAEQKIRKGDVTTIQFNGNNLSMIDGYQYTLELDMDKAEILSFRPVDPSVSFQNVNINQIEDGLIHMSWHKLSPMKDGETTLFEVEVQAKTDVWVSELTQISKAGIQAQAYYEGDIQDIELNYRTDELVNAQIELYQNQPNPWIETTEVKYFMPESGDVVLNVFDVNGRKVFATTQRSIKGINKITLKHSDLQSASGILYYELISGETRLMEKMLFIK